MAEDRFEPREINFRQWLPWTLLFRGFWVALDHKKLLLAAGGILTMAFGWWALSAAFFSMRNKPEWPRDYPSEKFVSKEDTKPGESEDRAWKAFTQDRRSWNLLYETAGLPDGPPELEDAGDLARTRQDFEKINPVLLDGKNVVEVDGRRFVDVGGERYEIHAKPRGKLRTWPWFEDRGPNPFLLATGHAGHREASGVAHYVPWQRGEFFDWLLGVQVPVLLEPLVKMLRPVYYVLQPSARPLDLLYFFLVIVWTVAAWAIFGGAITRIAAVEVARNEKIGMGEAVRFTLSRWKSYLFASFAPLLGLAFLTVVLMLFGLLDWIPIIGELWNGLLWWLVLGLGLAMAVLFIGLVGWPMIQATLSAEGSDSFDALSRSYSYVLQKPWSYLWYALVALAYGAVVVFFVGFMGSLMVYLGKWGVNHSPGIQHSSRDPSFMFVYAPTSFGWRQLLLQDSPVVNNEPVVTQAALDAYKNEFRPWNYLGAWLVTFWLWLAFLLILGFGYSYFWSASTIIYLLMRRKVDDTELDEVYLEEEDSEEPYGTPVTAPPPSPQPAPPATTPVQMVEAPALRTPVPTAAVAPPPAPSAAELPESKPIDGNVAAPGEMST